MPGLTVLSRLTKCLRRSRCSPCVDSQHTARTLGLSALNMGGLVRVSADMRNSPRQSPSSSIPQPPLVTCAYVDNCSYTPFSFIETDHSISQLCGFGFREAASDDSQVLTTYEHRPKHAIAVRLSLVSNVSRLVIALNRCLLSYMSNGIGYVKNSTRRLARNCSCISWESAFASQKGRVSEK